MSDTSIVTDAITSGLKNEPPPVIVPEPVPEPVPASEPTPAATETPTPQPEPQAASQPSPQQATAKPETGMVPITALLDEREKRKERDREVAEYRERLAQYEAPQQRSVQIPDPSTQPEEFAAYLANRDAEIARRSDIQLSQRWAEKQYGAETIQEASKWGIENGPGFKAWFLSQPDPFGWLMQQYERHQLTEKFGKDPDAYVRSRYAELNGAAAAQATGQAQPPVQTPTAPTTPHPAVPRSLATAPNAGSTLAPAPIDPPRDFMGAISAAARPRIRGSG